MSRVTNLCYMLVLSDSLTHEMLQCSRSRLIRDSLAFAKRFASIRCGSRSHSAKQQQTLSRELYNHDCAKFGYVVSLTVCTKQPNKFINRVYGPLCVPDVNDALSNKQT